jgi:hypothetical protein
MEVIMTRFKQWFQLLLMQGAIDGTHVHITKSKTRFAENYHYFKTRGYSIVAQAIMDIKKNNHGCLCWTLGSINDNLVLQKFNLYKQA